MANTEEDSTENAELLSKRNKEGEKQGSSESLVAAVGEASSGRARDYKVDSRGTSASAATAQRVRVHGLGSEDSGSRVVTPVDSDHQEDEMATVVAVRYNNDESPNGMVEGGDGAERPKKLFDESQAGVMELATMITDPNLKRSESSDLLHLNLYQVSSLLNMFISVTM